MRTNKILSILLIGIFMISMLGIVSPVIAGPEPFQILKGKPPGTGGGGGGGDPIPQNEDWGYVRMGSANARNLVQNGATVQVAVLDSGIDFNHADLAGLVTWCVSAIKRTFGCGRNTADDQGHGTHVAGIIAALDNSQDSVGGAAGFVEIYNFKVLGRRGGDWNDLAWAIRTAADGPDGVLGNADDADVISMSLGGDISSYPSTQSVLQSAIDYAISGGSVIIAAAGNEGTCEAGDVQYSWPAMSTGVVTVGATGIYKADGSGWATTYTGAERDVMPCFSNDMPLGVVDVSAPGVYITSLKKGGGTTEMSGTSMATPYVASVVALLLANGVASDLVLGKLTSTAIDLGYDLTLQGAGLVNAENAVGS